MQSPCVPRHRTRAGALRATWSLARVARSALFLLAFSPALFIAKLRNMCGVMLPVPFIEEQQPVNGSLAMVGMDKRSCKMFGFHRAPQLVPPRLHRITQRL